MKHFLRACITGAILTGLSACSTTPLGVVASVDVERAAGERTNPVFLQSNGGSYSDAALERYLNDIAAVLLTSTTIPEGYAPVSVGLLDTAVPNAYTLPGGAIYLSRGMVALANDEDELAGAIAHEIAHISARHVAKRRAALEQFVTNIARKARSDLTVGGSRTRRIAVLEAGVNARLDELAALSQGQELEADRIAAGILTSAGYDPAGLAALLGRFNAWQRLSDRTFGIDRGALSAKRGPSGYPDPAIRLAAFDTDALARMPGAQDRLMSLIDGLPFDDLYQGGYIRGGTYWHPALGISLDIPRGLLPTHDGYLVLLSPHGGLQVRFASDPEISLDTIAKSVQEREDGFRNLRRLTVNGFAALSGSASDRSEGTELQTRIVYIDLDGALAILSMTSSPGDAPRLARLYDALVASIARVEPASMPPRRHYEARRIAPGDSVTALAEASAFGGQDEEGLRLLNGWDAGEAVRPGRWVKRVR